LTSVGVKVGLDADELVATAVVSVSAGGFARVAHRQLADFGAKGNVPRLRRASQFHRDAHIVYHPSRLAWILQNFDLNFVFFASTSVVSPENCGFGNSATERPATSNASQSFCHLSQLFRYFFFFVTLK